MRQRARDASASPARTYIGRVHCRRRPSERATPVPERQFAWNGSDRTSAKPVQRLGCDSETGQGGGYFSLGVCAARQLRLADRDRRRLARSGSCPLAFAKVTVQSTSTGKRVFEKLTSVLKER